MLKPESKGRRRYAWSPAVAVGAVVAAAADGDAGDAAVPVCGNDVVALPPERMAGRTRSVRRGLQDKTKNDRVGGHRTVAKQRERGTQRKTRGGKWHVSANQRQMQSHYEKKAPTSSNAKSLGFRRQC